MIEPTRAAFLLIDMQNGFIDPTSALCVAGAADTVPACAHALDFARSIGMSIFHIRRIYSADGANVEPVRYRQWCDGGRPLSPASEDESSLNWPDLLTPADGDRVMVKPRFSAFFDTQLDDVLSREGISTVVLTGTTTPNCVRSTCYDALSLNYNVVILEDATSSRTPEVQRANIEDMAYIGAHIMSVVEFLEQGLSQVRDIAGDTARAIEAEYYAGGSAQGQVDRTTGAAAPCSAPASGSHPRTIDSRTLGSRTLAPTGTTAPPATRASSDARELPAMRAPRGI